MSKLPFLLILSVLISTSLSQPVDDESGNSRSYGHGNFGQPESSPPGRSPAERARNGGRRGWSPSGPGASSQQSPTTGSSPGSGSRGRRRRGPGSRRPGRAGSPGGFGGPAGAPGGPGGYGSTGGGGHGVNGHGSGGHGGGRSGFGPSHEGSVMGSRMGGPRAGAGGPPSIPDLGGRRMNSPPTGNYQQNVNHPPTSGESGRAGQSARSPGGGSGGSFGSSGTRQGGLSALDRRTFNPFATN